MRDDGITTENSPGTRRRRVSSCLYGCLLKMKSEERETGHTLQRQKTNQMLKSLALPVWTLNKDKAVTE